MYVEVEFASVEWFGRVRLPAAEFFAACGDEPGPRRVELVLTIGGQPGLGSVGIWDGEVRSEDDGEFVEITMPAMLGAPRWVEDDGR